MEGGYTDDKRQAIGVDFTLIERTHDHGELLNVWEREVLPPYQQKVLAATLAPFVNFGAAPALDSGTMILFMAIVMRLREEIEARCQLQEIEVRAKIERAMRPEPKSDRVSAMQRDVEALQELADLRWELYESALHGWNEDRRELDDMREKLEAEKKLYGGLHGQYVRAREAKEKAEDNAAELTCRLRRQAEQIRTLEEQNERLDERVERERYYYSELCGEHEEALEELERIEGVPGWMRHVAFKASRALEEQTLGCWLSVMAALGDLMESGGTDARAAEDLAYRALCLAHNLRNEIDGSSDDETNLDYEEEELEWD